MGKDKPHPDEFGGQDYFNTEDAYQDQGLGIRREPSPVRVFGVSIWQLVIADMRDRERFGKEKYGTHLHKGDGRRSLVDAYQEALDLCVYLRKAIAEKDDLQKLSAERKRYHEALEDIAAQPCRAEAEGASEGFACSQTGACFTEWCDPCRCGVLLNGENNR